MRLVSTFAVAGIAALAFGATAVVAQQDPLAQRKALMKGNNDNARIVVGMMRGTTPFDAKQVGAAFDQWAETAAKFGSLFPENSKGGDTRATPAVWTQRDKFNAEIAKFAKAIADNRAKGVSGVDGLKAAMGPVGASCDSCHETFRASR